MAEYLIWYLMFGWLVASLTVLKRDELDISQYLSMIILWPIILGATLGHYLKEWLNEN